MSTTLSVTEALAKHLQGLSCVRESGAIGYAEGWSLWTDGWCLLALQSDIGLGDYKILNGDKPAAGTLLAFMGQSAPVDAVSIPLADLRAFALQGRKLYRSDECECGGSHKAKAHCAECAGSGRVICECACGEIDHLIKCEECAGTGYEDHECPGCGPLDPHPRLVGLIFDRPFNLNLTAEALRILPVETALAAILTDEKGDWSLHLWAEGFRFAQMGMRDEYTDEKRPRFEARS